MRTRQTLAGPFGAALVAAAMLGAACSSTSEEKGITVALALEAPAGPPRAEGAPREVTRADGSVVTITRAYLSLEATDLEGCATARIWRALEGALTLERVAHAHSTSSPTRLGTPWVESLLAPPGARVTAGVFSPPPGRYCALRYMVGPADADAEGAPADRTLRGQSFHVEGTYRHPGAAAATDFTLVSSTSFALDLPFAGLELSAVQRSKTLVVHKALEAALQGVDFAGGTDETRAETLLAGVKATLAVTVE